MAVKVLYRLTTSAKRIFSKQYTFACIEQANQEFQQDDPAIAIHNTCQTHSNFRIYRMLFNFVHQIIYEIKSLRNFTFLTMKFSRTTVLTWLCVNCILGKFIR